MSVFKKTFTANSTVTLGANGASGGAFYLTFVKPLGTAALPSVSVAASDASATEGGDSGAFTVTRSGATTGALTVNFAVSGTATSGSDFVALGTSVTIPAGQSSAVVTVTPLNDATQELTETVVLTLAADAAYNLGTPSSATVSIADDDSPPLPVVTVIDSDTSAAEPSDPGAFTFTRTGDTTSALTVSFTLSGTATSGTDYTNPGTSIVIPAGQTSAVLTITPLDDTLVEGTETVTLSLASSAAYALGNVTTATVNIADNDTSALPVVTVTATDADAGEPSNSGAWTFTRTGSTAGALAVNFTASGTATRGSDYTLAATTFVTIPAGQASFTLALTVTNDALVEGTETAICTIGASANYTVGPPSSATINITDDDGGTTLPTVTITATDAAAAEPNDAGTFTITRTGATTSALTVNFAVNGTATSGTDFTSLGTSVSIAAGQAGATLTVAPIGDTTAESSETVIVTLSANAAYTLGTSASATVNIEDDDTSGTLPVITLSSSDNVAAETSSGNPNTGSVTVTRTGATTNALTVQLAYSGPAVNGADYVTMPASVTIAAGQATGTLTLTPIDDALIEGARTAVISATANAAYTLGSPAYASILINDNDNAAPITTTGIVFATHGSGANTRDVKLNVYLPATGSGPWPVLIYFPGGGWSVQTESSITPLSTNLTAGGYSVVARTTSRAALRNGPRKSRTRKPPCAGCGRMRRRMVLTRRASP